MHILSILHTVEAFFPLTEKKINSYGSEKRFFFPHSQVTIFNYYLKIW